MNPQAIELNNEISKANPVVLDLLSERGKNIFFPKKGILGQTADAKGKRINATIGAAIEDDNSPMRFKSLENLVNLNPALIFPYAPSFGRPDIREKWKSLIYDKNPSLVGKNISLPIVTSALTHGLSMVGYLFLNDGEKLFVSDLYWGNYNLIFANAYGVKIETYSLFEGNVMNLKSVRSKLIDGTIDKKVILFNFPNNPTGYTPTNEEIEELVSIINESAELGNKLVIIIDDAYFGLVYEEGIARESIFSWLADLHYNVLAVKLDGPTKEDYVWGFRTGFITYGIKEGTKEFYTAMEAKTAGAVRGNISNSSNLSQSLLLQAYQSLTYKDEKIQKYNILKGRYKKVKEVLTLNKQKYDEVFTPLPYNSGYFMCVKLKEGLDGEKIRFCLLNEYDTGIINLNNIIRVAYSSVAEKDIPELFDNIYNACRKQLI